MKSKLLLTAALLVLLISCKKDDDTNVVSLCSKIQISNSVFENTPSDEHEVLFAEIENNCLVVTVRYSGGGGEVFGELVTTEDIVENATERNLRFLFDDQSPRDALLSEVFSFDLIPLQNSTSSSIELVLQDFSNNPILYEY